MSPTRLDALLGDRADRHRRLAIDRLEQREHLLRPGYRVWGYKNVFA